MNGSALRRFAFVLLNLSGGAAVALAGANARAAEDEAGESEPEGASDGDSGSADAEKQTDGAPEEAKQGDAKADGEKGGDGEGASAGHGGQFGLRAGVVGGLRMIVRYEKSVYCKPPDGVGSLDNEPKFCGHVAPFALDFGLSFGLTDGIEPFAWARLGLGGEEQTDTNPLVLIGAGVRLYSMSDAPIKVLLEPAIALELEDGQGHEPWSLVPDGYSTDFVLHLAAGPQFDFSRNVGLYVTGGLTAGVVRALHASLDLQIGLQGRYP